MANRVNKIEEIGQYKYPNRSIQDKSYKHNTITESGAYKIPNDEKLFYSHPPPKINSLSKKTGGRKSRRSKKMKKTRKLRRVKGKNSKRKK